MTSSINSKVVPFGQAVDRLEAFLAGDESQSIDAPGGPIPSLRKLISEVKQAAEDLVQQQISDFVDTAEVVQLAANYVGQKADEAEVSAGIAASQASRFASVADALNDAVLPVVAVGQFFNYPDAVSGAWQGAKRTATSPFYENVGQPAPSRGQVDLGDAGATTISMSAGDVALSAGQARYPVLKLTGAPPVACALIVPTQWKGAVENATSTGFSITVRTAAGTGVAIPPAAKVALNADGTNVVRTVGDYRELAVDPDSYADGTTFPASERPHYKHQIATFNRDGNTVQFIARSMSGWPYWTSNANDKATRFALRGVTSIAIATPAVALSSTQAEYAVIRVTGPATADSAVIVPNVWKGTVENLTSGGFKLSVQTAAGAGVVVPPGAARALWSNGTDVKPQSSDYMSLALDPFTTGVHPLPEFIGQLGIYASGGVESYSFARTVNAGTTLKWNLIYTPSTLPSAIKTYLQSNAFLQLTEDPLVAPTAFTPGWKSQVGMFTDFNGRERPVLSRSLSGSPRAVVIDEPAYSGVLSDTSRLVSKGKDELFTHEASIAFAGVNDETCCVVYATNEINTAEGDPGQLIRMSVFHMLSPDSRVFVDVAVPGQSYGSITLDAVAIQVPTITKIDMNTVRVFFRPSVGGQHVIAYRDVNISTGALGAVAICQALTQSSAAPVALTQDAAYAHYDWLRGTVGALPGAVQEIFIVSEIRRFSDGALYTTLALGSGLNALTASILIKSSDNGVTWVLLGAPDPTTMPGTTGTDQKHFWEAAVCESTSGDSIYLYGRGAGSGPAAGLWRSVIAKATPYVASAPTTVYPKSGQKPSVLPLSGTGRGTGILLITTGSLSVLPATSQRTGLDVALIKSDHSVIARQFTALDYSGIHTAATVQRVDEVWIVYSTSRRRMPQIRSGVPQYTNTSEIMLTRLPRRLLQ